jgi:cell division protein FtsW (lipid II flippase)
LLQGPIILKQIGGDGLNRRSSLKYTLKETDFVLYFMCIILSAFGSLMVYSATRNDAIADGILLSRDCLIMLIASGVGIALCFFISFLDYD